MKTTKTLEDKAQNSFITKINRFAPQTPGSTEFCSPTTVDNPGPGTHFLSLKFMGHAKSTDAKRLIYSSKTHRDLKVAPRPVPPPIPGKKIAPDNFSGNGTDTVGPARYDPKFTIAKKAVSETLFAASKTKRTIFEPMNRKENEMPQRDMPGPGKYDSEFIVNNKMFNSTGNNSTFLSKVAKLEKLRASSQPGPGAYDVKTVPNGDRSMIGSGQESSTEQSSVLASNANPFLSSTSRGEMWRNLMSAPFTRPGYLKNPGPGSYGQSKNKDDIK